MMDNIAQGRRRHSACPVFCQHYKGANLSCPRRMEHLCLRIGQCSPPLANGEGGLVWAGTIDNCPGDGLDNLTLTGRTVTATTAITVADIAQALALLPAKVQRGGLVLANASTLAGVLMEKNTYAFDPSSTLQSLGVELVQDPHVADNTVYVTGELSQTLFLNFWQNISVRRSEDALLAKNAIAFLASCVCGFAWNSSNVAKVTLSA